MFRHEKKSSKEDPKEEKTKEERLPEKKEKEETEKPPILSHSTDNEVLNKLLEKNLKWSQIIYEQNRRINRKLIWMAVAGWVRLLIFVLPIILAIIYLPPFAKELWDVYMGVATGTGGAESGSMIGKLLELLGGESGSQVKAIFK